MATIVWDFYELWNWDAFLKWKSQVGYLPFFVGLALLPLLGFPMTPLFILAGATFTPPAAILGCAIAIAVNQAVSYWLAKRWLRGFVTRQMKGWNLDWPEHNQSQTFSFLLVVRLTPGIPTFLKNYVTALTGTPFSIYLGVSWVFTFIYAVGFIVMRDSIVNQSPVEAIVGLCILAAAFLVVLNVRRRFSGRHQLKKSISEPTPSAKPDV